MAKRAIVFAVLVGVFAALVGILPLVLSTGGLADNISANASPSPYIVDGLALGSRVRIGSDAYRQYQCSTSDQFVGFTWCQKQKEERTNGEEVTSSNTILHKPDGTVVYVNRYIEPAFFGSNDAVTEMDRLSAKFGERARQTWLPQREGLPNAVIAVWGRVQLEPLDAGGVSILASGDSPHKGLLVSFIGDLERSAKLGVPIYRLTGGAGFVWAASFNKTGRGVLRFLAVDASQINPRVEVATPLPLPIPTPPAPPASAKTTSPPPVDRTEKRVALVIGNGRYLNTGPLTNPPNDASAMTKVLLDLGFDVVQGIDLDKRSMEQKLREYNRKLGQADLALFFYAGHGMQVAGENYLVPVDARLEAESDLELEMIKVSLVLKLMQAQNSHANVIFLDACRDNPLARRLQRTLGASRGFEVGEGLAAIREAGLETLIEFAAGAGQTAADGAGADSPFTEALLQHIYSPGLDVQLMMRNVRSEVYAASKGEQIPSEYGSLTKEIILLPRPRPGLQPVGGPAPSAPLGRTAR